MSRQELQCFLEFAPHYFCYVNKALDEQVRLHVTGSYFTIVAMYWSFFGYVRFILISFRYNWGIFVNLR